MTGTFCVCRGTEVMLRNIGEHDEAVALAEELSHISHENLAVVKVLDIIPGKEHP